MLIARILAGGPDLRSGRLPRESIDRAYMTGRPSRREFRRGKVAVDDVAGNQGVGRGMSCPENVLVAESSNPATGDAEVADGIVDQT